MIDREIASRNLHASVRCLGLRRDVARLLAASDAFLLTSISEGIPLTLIEAMAAGLPIVSTDVGGVPEVVDNTTGLLASAGDDDQLSQHLAHLAAQPALRQQMAAAGKVRAHELFSEQKMHAAYTDLYDEMMHG